jgi:hypothetical protein
MKLIIALSPSFDVNEVTAGLRSGGWTIAEQASDAARQERAAAVLSPAGFEDRLPALLATEPGARVVVAFHLIESELALAIADGQPADVALAGCRAFVRGALATFRRNRRRVALVSIAPGPSGADALGQVVSAPIALQSEPPIDPVLLALVRQLLDQDAAFRRDLDELDASVVAPMREPDALSAAAAIERWRVSFKATQAQTDEVARLRAQLQAAEADLAAARMLAAEREAAREEIALLREQLRASQEALEELPVSLDDLDAGLSRTPRLASGQLCESVDLTGFSGIERQVARSDAV